MSSSECSKSTQVHSVYIVADLVAPNYKVLFVAASKTFFGEEVSFRDITYAACMANDQDCKTLASFTLESAPEKTRFRPFLNFWKVTRVTAWACQGSFYVGW